MAARAAEAQSQGATYSHGNAMDGREQAPRIVSSAGGVAGRGSRRGRGWHYCDIPAVPTWAAMDASRVTFLLGRTMRKLCRDDEADRKSVV